ncbi:MAG TPA: PASTA domain-containing protein [Gemmatimonadales bacterium]|nr:PASTA domain-containing protein [Gemmatimonadales bacterium]
MSARFDLRRLRPDTVRGRERLRAALLLAAAALGGYFVTCVAYPAPLMTRDYAVGRVLGLPLDEAEKVLAEEGLKTKLDGERADPVIPAGHVVWQDPPPGVALPRGAVVHLTTSDGAAPVSVPDVAGFEVPQARQVIEVAGLRIGEVDTVPNVADAGVIVATRPPGGTARPAGSKVGLLVSKGPADTRVPDVVGLDQEEARRRLEMAGLKVGKIAMRAGRGRAGLVLQQRPGPGVLSPKETRVDLLIIP